jgi:integrase
MRDLVADERALQRTRHPGIYKRGGRYVVIWKHRGRQHKEYFRTLAEAREAKGHRAAGETRPETRDRFEDYAREWVHGYAGRTSKGIAEKTRLDYERALEQYVIPFFRGWRLAEIEPPDVRRFVRDLEASGLRPTSVIKNLAPLKLVYATAIEDGVVRFNPTTAVRVSRRDDGEEEPLPKAMTRAELSRLLAEVPEQWLLFFELLTHTGLRISEQLGLNGGDVRLGSKPHLQVRRQYYRGQLRRLKTRNARRDLPLSPGMARKLRAAKPADPEQPLFATSFGTRYYDRNVRKVLDAAAKRADITGVSFHNFRHTCASLLFESGKNIRQVSDWLGHADPAFTLRTYVHLMDAGLGDAGFFDAVVDPTG